MRAIVLAAGRGTRMGRLTADRPKPLVEVAGEPLVSHVLRGLGRAGLTEVTLVVGHLGHQIEAAIGDGAALGVTLSYRWQARPDGTAGALLAARADVRAPFLLTWGDVLVAPATYRAVRERFRPGATDAVLAVNEVDDPWAGAAVYLDRRGRVRRLVEKPAPGSSTTRWNNAGVLALDPVVLAYAERLQPSPRGELELPQAVAAMLADGRRVVGVPVVGVWRDVGTPADLAAIETLLRAGEPAP